MRNIKLAPHWDLMAIHLCSLKICYAVLLNLSRSFFCLFMSTGQVPVAWKQATVTPVFIGGIESDPFNNRLISLTSVFSKLMKRVVVLDMLCYCKEQGLISKQQYGFLARRSTVTNMLSCMNDWTLMKRSSVAVAYINFQKAFDSVCHTSHGAIVQRCLRDPTFSRFDTIPECDRHTHTHTHRHTTTAYTALSIAVAR